MSLYSCYFFLGDEATTPERSFSFSQITSSFGKKSPNETVPEIVHSTSFQDIFTSENSEQAKDMIMNNVRQELNRSLNRASSDSSFDDFTINKIDHVGTTIGKTEKNKRKPTMLLAGPKFRYHTTESEYNLKRDTIYPVSVCIPNRSNIALIIVFQSASYSEF
jgi:hypothetical protein